MIYLMDTKLSNNLDIKTALTKIRLVSCVKCFQQLSIINVATRLTVNTIIDSP